MSEITPSWLDYVRLVRLPNVFTAVADVTMGYFFVCGVPGVDARWSLGWLIAASCLLYSAGTVLNDLFDYELDLQERPERPLPDGRVARGAAAWFGWGLLAAGVVAAGTAAYYLHLWLPAAIGGLLAAAVVLYDAWLKRTPLGPLGMGLCRMLNVLLGMSAAAAAWSGAAWLVAGAIGVYVAGLTWLARGEAGRSPRLPLAFGTAVMLLGIAMLGLLPRTAEGFVPLLREDPGRWYLMVSVLGLLISWRCVWAVFDPHSAIVQAAVRQALLSLVMLDAAAAFAKCDMPGALIVAALLIPAIFTAQWIEAT